MQGDNNLQDMGNNLKSIITNNIQDSTQKDNKESLEVLHMLLLLFNTKITNYYIVMVSASASKKDNLLMKYFKQ